MVAMTYGSLAANIPVLLMAQNRAWPGEVENTIRKGQERLLLGIHPDFLTQKITDTLGAFDPEDTDGSFIDLSGRAYFGELKSLWIEFDGRRRMLLPRAHDYCVTLYALGQTGVPRFYAERTRGAFELFPSSNVDLIWTATANLQTDLISPTVATNLLTEKLPTLLEYACCIEGALWMKDKAATDLWLAAFTDLLTATNANIRRRRSDETSPGPKKPENAWGAP